MNPWTRSEGQHGGRAEMPVCGGAREIKEFVVFLKEQKTQRIISKFCSAQWKFTPEGAPHFGSLWEAAVKSTKTHLRSIVAKVKLTFEEFTTVLAQVKACLNSRLLAPLPCDDNGVEVIPLDIS